MKVQVCNRADMNFASPPPGSVPQRSRCSWARHRMRYMNSSPPAA